MPVNILSDLSSTGPITFFTKTSLAHVFLHGDTIVGKNSFQCGRGYPQVSSGVSTILVLIQGPVSCLVSLRSVEIKPSTIADFVTNPEVALRCFPVAAAELSRSKCGISQTRQKEERRVVCRDLRGFCRQSLANRNFDELPLM